MSNDQNDKDDELVPSTSSNAGIKRFELTKWAGVAVWSWDIAVDNCAICRNHIMQPCIECQADQKTTVCTVALGECKHAFHFHCISRWVQTRNVCPLDNTEWSYRKYGQ